MLVESGAATGRDTDASGLGEGPGEGTVAVEKEVTEAMTVAAPEAGHSVKAGQLRKSVGPFVFESTLAVAVPDAVYLGDKAQIIDMPMPRGSAMAMPGYAGAYPTGSQGASDVDVEAGLERNHFPLAATKREPSSPVIAEDQCVSTRSRRVRGRTG